MNRIRNGLVFCFLLGASFSGAMDLSCRYPSVVEKLLFYKDNLFKVFYGGPISGPGGVRWMMPVSFEDDSFQTRAVYEIAFIHCTPETAQDAEILFISAADIDIKFKNTFSDDYRIFHSLMEGKYSSCPHLVIRMADIANIYYPDIFVSSVYSSFLEEDKKRIAEFLCSHFKTQNRVKDYYLVKKTEEVDFENSREISYKSVVVGIDFSGHLYRFKIVKKILKEDSWKVYYLISRFSDSDSEAKKETPLIRIDSACVSGQIYHDETCDCMDQLHRALYEISQKAGEDFIVHIATQDGRGYGTAPKAETEIYKRGGRGRVHATSAVDTVSGAKLLYFPEVYEIRTYDGVAEILRAMGLKRVSLLTDNIVKTSALQRHGLEVTRKPTQTYKESCSAHLESKQNSPLYFKD